MSQATTEWKWDLTHDGPIHHWMSHPITSPAPTPPAIQPASQPSATVKPATTKPTTAPRSPLEWYVLHDGVMIPMGMDR